MLRLWCALAFATEKTQTESEYYISCLTLFISDTYVQMRNTITNGMLQKLGFHFPLFLKICGNTRRGWWKQMIKISKIQFSCSLEMHSSDRLSVFCLGVKKAGHIFDATPINKTKTSCPDKKNLSTGLSVATLIVQFSFYSVQPLPLPLFHCSCSTRFLSHHLPQ